MLTDKTPTIKSKGCKNNFFPKKKKKIKKNESQKKNEMAHRIPISPLSFYENLNTM